MLTLWVIELHPNVEQTDEVAQGKVLLDTLFSKSTVSYFASF